MKKVKQILAIIAIVILVGMYLTSLILAIFVPKAAMGALYISLFLTVFIPIILWIFIATFSYIAKRREELMEENSATIASANEETDKADDSEIEE